MDSYIKPFALITGASSGIGKAIAIELAQKGHPLLLVALDEPILYSTSKEIETNFNVTCHTFGIDLCKDGACKKVYDWTETLNADVNILINNAGFGRGGQLNAFELQEYERMIDLNNKVNVQLTYLFRNKLKQQKQSHILMMSSMEATLPLPYKAVYAGTKQFVYGFGLALQKEFEEDNIFVTVVCPGPTATNEAGKQRLKDQKNANLILKMPEDVARIAVKAMFKKKSVVIPGNLQKILFSIGKHLPNRLKMRLLKRLSYRFKNNPC